MLELREVKVSINLCSALNCSIIPSQFGAAVLMGNHSSNKAAYCRSIQTLSSCCLSLQDRNTAGTKSDHVRHTCTVDPSLRLCPGGWAFQFQVYLIWQFNMDQFHSAWLRVFLLSVSAGRWGFNTCLCSSVPAGVRRLLWLWKLRWGSACELLGQREDQRWTCHLLTGKHHFKPSLYIIQEDNIGNHVLHQRDVRDIKYVYVL